MRGQDGSCPHPPAGGYTVNSPFEQLRLISSSAGVSPSGLEIRFGIHYYDVLFVRITIPPYMTLNHSSLSYSVLQNMFEEDDAASPLPITAFTVYLFRFSIYNIKVEQT